MKIILVIGDRSEQASALAQNLGLHGIEAIPCARDWKLAVRCMTSHQISLILAGIDRSSQSIEFFSTLIELTEIPVVALGPGTDADTMVWYLDNGASDYIPASTSLNVIAAKIHSRLREMPEAEDGQVVQLHDLTIDLSARTVSRGVREASLTPLEYRLLRVLAENLGRTCSRRMLLEQVWGTDFEDCTHYLRLYVGYLRQKLESNPAKPRYLVTDWGHGYRLVDPAPGARGAARSARQLRPLPTTTG